MNPEIKAEWIANLESGNIAQGQGYLGNLNGKRCCLGVLCDIAVKHGVIPMPRIVADHHFRYGDYETMPPHEVYDWAGINTVIDVDLISSLVKMNDREYPFSEIAQVIREKL